MLSDKHVEFAHFPKRKKSNISIGVPYIIITYDHRAELNVAYLNKAITKITFQFGPVRIVDISQEYGADCYVYLVTVARDRHNVKQWTKIFSQRFE